MVGESTVEETSFRIEKSCIFGAEQCAQGPAIRRILIPSHNQPPQSQNSFTNRARREGRRGQREAMVRGNAALKKKLAELESEIGRLLEHPSSYIHDDVNGEAGFFYQTTRKITFTKNLLTAEMDSHSGDRPEHLKHTAVRLSILEKTFVNWAKPAGFPIADKTLVNGVESGDGHGSVNKNSDTSASCSCAESCVFDEEEFGGEDNFDREAREVEVTKDEKTRGRKQGETVGESTVEITEDGEEARTREERGKLSESNVTVSEVEKVGEKKQEAEMAEERKSAATEDAKERNREREGETVEEEEEEEVEVEAAEEKGRWKQEIEMIEERDFEAGEDNRNETKEGAELVGEREANEIGEAMAGGKTAEVKDEKETETNQGRRMVGKSIVEMIDDQQEESNEEEEIMRAITRGRERKPEAEMVGMHTMEVKEDEKRRERKQQSFHRIKNCMAIGCAAAAGFAIALIGVAVASAEWKR